MNSLPSDLRTYGALVTPVHPHMRTGRALMRKKTGLTGAAPADMIPLLQSHSCGEKSVSAKNKIQAWVTPAGLSLAPATKDS